MIRQSGSVRIFQRQPDCTTPGRILSCLLWTTTAVYGMWCSSLHAVAQTFQSLSTTEDGSAVYFSSPIREKGTDQSFHSKIFRWDPTGGIRLIGESRDTGESDGCTTANYY